MEAADTQEIRTQLTSSHDGFRQLVQQHHTLDHRLQELTVKSHLSETEQLEEVDLKKRKLALKDEMERIIRDHRTHVIES